MPRTELNVRHRLAVFVAVGACVVLPACTDDTTVSPDPNTTTRSSIFVDVSDGGATATAATQARSFDACAALSEEAARDILGVGVDAPLTRTESGERCTWREGDDAASSVTLSQGARQDVDAYVADHPGAIDLASDDQKDQDQHIFVQEVGSGAQITVLLTVGTYVLSVPDRPDDAAKMVADLLGIG